MPNYFNISSTFSAERRNRWEGRRRRRRVNLWPSSHTHICRELIFTNLCTPFKAPPGGGDEDGDEIGFPIRSIARIITGTDCDPPRFGVYFWFDPFPNQIKFIKIYVDPPFDRLVIKIELILIEKSSSIIPCFYGIRELILSRVIVDQPKKFNILSLCLICISIMRFCCFFFVIIITQSEVRMRTSPFARIVTDPVLRKEELHF